MPPGSENSKRQRRTTNTHAVIYALAHKNVTAQRPLFSMRPEASDLSIGSTASAVSSNLPPSSLMGMLLPRSEATWGGTTVKVPGMRKKEAYNGNMP